MSDLIDRQAVLKAIFQKPAYHNSEGSYYHSDDIRKAVESIETPEPQTGHWHTDKATGTCYCSCCDSPAYLTLYCEPLLSEWCPDCGAYMIEEDEQEEDDDD